MARTDIDAQDYFGSQQKKLGVADRRPVIRKASDLVGPGINANAVRLTDFNNLLATYDGFFSAEDTALHAPGSGESYVGTVASDSDLGGMQSFSGLTTGTAWQRVFLRNPSDAATIYWGAWEIIGTAGTGGSTFLETLPASIIDAKGDLIVGAADNDPVRFPVGTDGTSLVSDSSATDGLAWANRVATLVPGANITVDDTDPLNPVISTIDIGQLLWEYNDSLTVTTLGTQTFYLSHVPFAETLQIWWGGIPQPPTEWSVSGNVVTITDPTSRILVGHIFSAYYAYNPNSSDGLILDFASLGPYKIVAENSTTDYSDPTLDDSAWTSALWPIGYPVGSSFHTGYPLIPPGTSSGTTDCGIWLRRHLTTFEASASLAISARADGQWWLYVDGVLTASDPTAIGFFPNLGPYNVTVGPGDHVIALHVNDDTPDPVNDGIYADLKIVVTDL